MRDAALEIALRGDDFALSYGDRLGRALVRLWRDVTAAGGRRPDRLDGHDPRRLADLGLSPADLPVASDPFAAAGRGWPAGEDRWRRL
ncbi:hypothetical protein EYW49_08245 [Siculibacillus lacustris]|uniref:Uncharacterized protein n=1 Tax=Siculibacillus lacustris TaxID=1549641 RepID=A0A4V2KTU2_9HYPH|nr:hypothetical protein [Siculibacillus lacustris]TBW38680.1 hypothetical protein EYW49_08245 [Siculibacillus lacustris]